MKNTHTFWVEAALTYTGTVIGAGFATGQELLAFFVRYGVFGFCGILIAAAALFFGGSLLLRVGQVRVDKRNLWLPSRYERLFYVAALIVTAAAMLAGSRALFETATGHGGWWIPLLLGFASLAPVVAGVQGLFAINKWIVPLVVLTVFITAIYNFLQPEVPIPSSSPSPASLHAPWLPASLAYAGLNLFLAMGVLFEIGSTLQAPHQRWQVAGGGTILLLVCMALESSLLFYHPQWTHSPIPMLFAAQRLGDWMRRWFSMVIALEIYSTLVANLFAALAVMPVGEDPHRLGHSALFLLLSISLSLLGFTQLVNRLYPLLGFIGLLLVIRTLIHRPEVG
ncbi:MAG: hypothetical protein IMW91_02405 [Firmicutes bacterium]|nr:hypothetical protein [Bacillota bacterium]